MKGCEICNRSHGTLDVLCNACRETISRLAALAQEQPVVPTTDKVTQIDAYSRPAAVGKSDPQKRRFFRFPSFLLFQGGKTKANESKKVSVSQNQIMQSVREK